MPRSTRRLERPRTPIPESLTVEESGNELVVRWRRSKLRALCHGFLSMVTASIAFVHILIGLSWSLYLLALANAALTYTAIAVLWNRTELVLGAGSLCVSHGPLPWPGVRIASTHEVESISCTVTRGRTGRAIGLEILLKDGRTRVLLARYQEDEMDVPLFLQWKLEEFLELPGS